MTMDATGLSSCYFCAAVAAETLSAALAVDAAEMMDADAALSSGFYLSCAAVVVVSKPSRTECSFAERAGTDSVPALSKLIYLFLISMLSTTKTFSVNFINCIMPVSAHVHSDFHNNSIALSSSYLSLPYNLCRYYLWRNVLLLIQSFDARVKSR